MTTEDNLLPTITEASILQDSTPQSYERGEDDYDAGAVEATVQRGMTLEASVGGTQYEPYHVTITFNKLGVQSAVCTCPL